MQSGLPAPKQLFATTVHRQPCEGLVRNHKIEHFIVQIVNETQEIKTQVLDDETSNVSSCS